MALNGSVRTNTADDTVGLVFSWTATQSYANNTSTISWVLASYGGTASNWWMAAPVTLTVDGTTAAGIADRFKLYGNGAWSRAGSLVVTHDGNGARSFSVAIRAAIYEYEVNCTASATFTLDTIARASSLSVSAGTLGVAQTIAAGSKASRYTHTLSWVSGTYSGTICERAGDTEWTFTPPLELANGAPYGTSVYIRFTLQTYDGDGICLGEAVKAVYLAIPAAVKPTCSLTISDAAQHAATFGGYIRGQSQIQYAVSAAPGYGAPITAYAVTAEGTKRLGASGSFTPANAGSLTVSATVTDGRGRTASDTATVEVLDYAPPAIPYLSVHRCDADGTENASGSYAAVTYSHEITSLSDRNSKAVTLQYRKAGDAAYTSVTLPAAYTATRASYLFAAADDASYDIVLTVADALTAVTRTTSVSTAYCLYHVPASGKGITFGKIAEGDGFCVAMPARFTAGLTEELAVLASGDCDQLTDSGRCYCGSNVDNKPYPLNGWLDVRSYDGGAYCYQAYITYSGLRFHRLRQDGTWGAWVSETAALLDRIYPVGAIYLSVSAVSPSVFLGGTWEPFGAGRTLVGVDPAQTEFATVQKTGGAKTHTLTLDQIPGHTHEQNVTLHDSSGSFSSNTDCGDYTATARSVAQGVATGASGGGGAHNNLPPYITCYMWRRTA